MVAVLPALGFASAIDVVFARLSNGIRKCEEMFWLMGMSPLAALVLTGIGLTEDGDATRRERRGQLRPAHLGRRTKAGGVDRPRCAGRDRSSQRAGRIRVRRFGDSLWHRNFEA